MRAAAVGVVHDEELFDLPVPDERLERGEVLEDWLHAARGGAQDEGLVRPEAEELLGVGARVAARHDDGRGEGEVHGGHLGEKGAGLEGGEGGFVPSEEVCDRRAGCGCGHGGGSDERSEVMGWSRWWLGSEGRAMLPDPRLGVASFKYTSVVE